MKKAVFFAGMLLSAAMICMNAAAGETSDASPAAAAEYYNPDEREVLPASNETDSPESGALDGAQGKIEGEGFDSPEDAATAYVMGWKDGNLNEMLSAYAVETYVENYSLARMLDRMKAYSPSMKYIPSVSELSLALNIENRRAEIAGWMRSQYLMLTEAAIALEENSGTLFPPDDEPGWGEDFVKRMFTADDTAYLSEISYDKKFYAPSALSEIYLSETNQKNLERQAEVIGADAIESVVTSFISADRECVLCMDTVRYGDRWYVLTASGNIGTLLGLNISCAGLMPLSSEEAAQLHGM